MSIEDARSFAIEAHGDQRYGDAPYVAHLDAVHDIATSSGGADEALRMAAYLHDVIEDTEVTRAQVASRFGERVAAMVDAVSDPPGFDDRKARKAAAYPRIRAVPGATWVKLCDRLANARACVANNPRLLAMYRAEHPGFRDALYQEDAPAPVLALWAELDSVLA